MSEEIKAKDVIITLVYVAVGLLAITAAVWLFYPSSYGTVCFLPAEEVEEGVPVIKITGEILAEYPMLAGPPESLVTHDTIISQIFGDDGKIHPGTAQEIREKFGSAYLDYDGRYYVIGLMVS